MKKKTEKWMILCQITSGNSLGKTQMMNQLFHLLEHRRRKAQTPQEIQIPENSLLVNLLLPERTLRMMGSSV